MENLSRMTVFVGLERPNVSEWIPIVRTSAGNSLTRPKDQESLWTWFLLMLTGT